MQFVLILAVLAALAISESAPCRPVSGPAGRLLIAAAAVALVTLFAMAVSGLTARRLRADFASHRRLLQRFRHLRRVHLALWLVTAGGILYGLDWAQLVRFNWHLDRWFLLDDLLILAPVLVPLVLSWAAFYEVDRAVHVGLAGRTPLWGKISTRHRYLAFHLRHYLGILLVPVLGLLALQDAVELLAPGMVESGRDALIFIPALAMLFLLFPVLLRYLWQTRPLPPGPLRTRLEEAARRCGFRARDILVWQTDGMIVNAAVAGLARPLRYVFLTDALLLLLDEEEIEAVFGHEVGHVRHHHLPLRVLTILAPLSLWLLARQAVPGAVDRFEAWLAGGALGVQAPIGVAMLAAMAVYVFVVFGYYSRLLEHQADLFGCRWAMPDARQSAVEAFTSALEKLAAAAGTGRNTRSWQHASIGRRIAFLNQLRQHPNRELHFHRQVRLLGIFVIGIVISPLIHHLLLG